MPNILEAKNISKKYGSLAAVNNINIEIKQGEIFGLVGESGCGKSTTARIIMRLIDLDSGSVFFENNDIALLKGGRLRRIRKRMQIIFQDPLASLNPRISIGDAVKEPLIIHKMCDKKEVETRHAVSLLLDSVGLPHDYIKRYPHELSGGENQRVCIARALATEPSFIILDEPVSSLDAHLQAKIIDMLMQIKSDKKLTYLFITHDLFLAKQICDTIAVMKNGSIVEVGKTEEIFNNPKENYTRQLIEDSL